MIFRLKIDGNVKFEKSIDSVKNSKLSNYLIFRINNFISIPRIWLFDWLWNWLGVRILKWSQIDFHFWRWFIFMIFWGITGQIEKSKVGCVFPMVAVCILLHAVFGRINYRDDAPHCKKMNIGHSFGRFLRKNNEFRTENRFNHHEMMIAIVFIFDNLRTHCVPWATFPKFETTDL